LLASPPGFRQTAAKRPPAGAEKSKTFLNLNGHCNDTRQRANSRQAQNGYFSPNALCILGGFGEFKASEVTMFIGRAWPQQQS
jgi:hypothetical protein